MAIKAPASLTSPIAEEVRQGLTSTPKQLPPKLFYDAAGSRLFELITETPEYYPTRTERAILQRYASEIVRESGPGLTLVELGAGSANKTRLLIEALLRRQLRAEFYPVDVSPSALQDALHALNGDYPQLRVSPIVADYSHALPDLKALPGRKLVLFIGSTIGNFEPEEARDFLARVRAALSGGDTLLLGFDMRKNPVTLHRAYNDAEGTTARFNKNVLARINRELGANFELDAFKHVAFWNSRKSRIEMHLESTVRQTVWIDDLGLAVHFERCERIHTENSYKFTETSIKRLLKEAGLRPERIWMDEQHWFSEVLARV